MFYLKKIEGDFKVSGFNGSYSNGNLGQIKIHMVGFENVVQI